jgi:hypothetical protein
MESFKDITLRSVLYVKVNKSLGVILNEILLKLSTIDFATSLFSEN